MLEIKEGSLFPAAMNLSTAEVLCAMEASVGVGASASLTPGSGSSPPGTEKTPGIYCPLLWGSRNLSAQHFWWQPEAF